MAKKEEKKTVKPSVKKMVNNILMKHPEVLNNARNLFRNENGRTIVEDRVPRGDPKREDVGQPFNVYDLTDTDLRDLAKYASDIVDAGIMRYDENTAYEDALHRAINEKDGGKYAGKVNANTYALILSTITKPKKSTDKKAYDETDKSQSSNNVVKEGSMSRSDEIKKLEAKIASLQKQEDMEKLASLVAGFTTEEREQFKAILKAAAEAKKRGGNQNDPKTWQDTMDSIGKTKKASEECKETPETKKEEEKKVEKATGKPHDEDEPEHEDTETKEEKKIEGEKDAKKDEKKEDKDASVVDELDKIAGELENLKDYEYFKMAYQIDTVADVLEGKKTAAALQSDPDEKFMREAFNWTIHQKDSDEKFMNSFATDKTQEVSKAYANKPYGIVK